METMGTIGGIFLNPSSSVKCRWLGVNTILILQKGLVQPVLKKSQKIDCLPPDWKPGC